MRGYPRSVLSTIKINVSFTYENPANRTCDTCGQQQILYGMNGTTAFDEWESVGRIIKKSCNCHLFEKEYKR